MKKEQVVHGLIYRMVNLEEGSSAKQFFIPFDGDSTNINETHCIGIIIRNDVFGFRYGQVAYDDIITVVGNIDECNTGYLSEEYYAQEYMYDSILFKLNEYGVYDGENDF